MARTDPQVNFRMPAHLKDRLEKAAQENGRSVTQELIARLEESFELDDFDLPERLQAIEEKTAVVEKQTNLLWEALQKAQAKKKG